MKPEYPEYTTEIHVKRLKRMIELNGETCDQCPASEKFGIHNEPYKLWNIHSEVCKLCSEFVGVPDMKFPKCPCHYYDTAEETFRITLEKIKEWEEENGE